FLQEALRWWDRWLKGIDTGVLDEPLCRIWMQESPDGAGRWVAEATWPSPRITPKRHALAPGRLEEAAGPEVPVEWRSPPAVALNHIAHAFAAGSRLRLALSTAYWPVVWPSPQPVTLTLFTGASGLELPVRAPDPGDDRLRPFEEPEGAPPASYVELRPRRVE